MRKGCYGFSVRELLAVAVFWLISVHLAAQDAERPDVLFITIDDLNDWVSVLDGHSQVRTPNMERLAARGLTFTNAHASAVVCNPSRTSFLTGLRPSTSGVYMNSPRDRAYPVRTLPGFFKDAGYQTLGAGKLFHRGNNDKTAWRVYYPALDVERPDKVMPSGSVPTNKSPFKGGRFGIDFDWAPLVAEDQAMADGQVVDWSAQQILATRSVPRFSGVGIYRPHPPWYVPGKYFEMYPLGAIELPLTIDNDLEDVSDLALKVNSVDTVSLDGVSGRSIHEWVITNDLWTQAVQGYLASVSFSDALLGRLLDALDESGRAPNTVIVMLGDPGFHVGEKSVYGKKTLWRESTRIPLIIVAPGQTQPGTRTDATVSLLDLYPTLTDLAGIGTPEHLEGTSLVPLLKNPDLEWDRPVLTTHGYGNHSVTGDRYHYIRYSDGSEELYDLISDPHEYVNLAEEPGLAGVKNDLGKWFPEHNEPDTRGISFPWREVE